MCVCILAFFGRLLELLDQSLDGIRVLGDHLSPGHYLALVIPGVVVGVGGAALRAL